MTPRPATPSFSDTDLCVKCGLCLPHCPTYIETLNENESPRGRLALIQGWAAGQLATTPRLLEHIDRCLLCRSCEAVCPAQVPYGRLLDDFRNATREPPGRANRRHWRAVAIRWLLETPAMSRLAKNALPLARATRLPWLLGLGELSDGLPLGSHTGSWHGVHRALGEERGRVGLFLGCTAELADGATVQAALNVLTRLGITVHVPSAQTCCGAMALHAGERATAESLWRCNVVAFANLGLDAVVTIASGCGAVLAERLMDAGLPPVLDISHYLAQLVWPPELRLRPLDATAVLHTPCTLKNVLKAASHPGELLRRIPKLRVQTLRGPNCCGAAGTYQLEQPDMARKLRRHLLEQLPGPADYLLTSNVGCALHLRAGLQGRIPVMHPVVLLARQWPAD